MLIPAKELIQKTIDIYKENFKLFFSYVIALFIPTGIITILSTFVKEFAASDSARDAMIFNGYFVLLLASWFATFWITASFIRVFYAKYNGKEVRDIKTELSNVKHVLIPAILASILSTLIIIVGYILFIIPGVIFSIWYFFTLHEAVINEKKVVEAIKSSKELVKGRWWAVLWRLFASILIFAILMLIIGGLVGGILGLLTSGIDETSSVYTFALIMSSLITSFVSILFIPLTNGAPIILFTELQKTPKVAEITQKQ
ncbi:MAG: glycerophosphoryl diester phosphodiesterase membrane domain-containing protein [Candidatus Magasanikbacteria bacterium]|nr:glycerophosphoryl diester phosphodiesterase membrane domain-containing protein [Candidatus Magasanikbacteria bacterium]